MTHTKGAHGPLCGKIALTPSEVRARLQSGIQRPLLKPDIAYARVPKGALEALQKHVRPLLSMKRFFLGLKGPRLNVKETV